MTVLPFWYSPMSFSRTHGSPEGNMALRFLDLSPPAACRLPPLHPSLKVLTHDQSPWTTRGVN